MLMLVAPICDTWLVDGLVFGMLLHEEASDQSHDEKAAQTEYNAQRDDVTFLHPSLVDLLLIYVDCRLMVHTLVVVMTNREVLA